MWLIMLHILFVSGVFVQIAFAAVAIDHLRRLSCHAELAAQSSVGLSGGYVCITQCSVGLSGGMCVLHIALWVCLGGMCVLHIALWVCLGVCVYYTVP